MRLAFSGRIGYAIGVTIVGKAVVYVKKMRFTALTLCLCLLLGLCACGNRTGGAYTRIGVLMESTYGIGFRNEDPAADYVEAALKVMAANGQIHESAVRWFSDDPTYFPGDANALDGLDPPEPRVFIMGVDPDNFPMSYRDGENYNGFDVELARQVCQMLGWELRFQNIGDESDAYVELSSGNVDCVWGGMMLSSEQSKYRVVGPYMDCDIVVVVLAGNHLGSLRKLSDRAVAMNDAKKYADAVAASELNGNVGELRQLATGNDKLFDGLVRGDYDAIVTDSAAAMYYMR